MKKHLLTLCLLIISNFLHAQDIAFIPSNYVGGYNVSCNGATDGTLQAVLNGYGAPYTYQWSNGSYSSTIANIGAGTYTLTVTNTFGDQITNSYDMIQPNPFIAIAYVSDYNGSNVSENGANDGHITIEPTGGGAAGNSTYLWSNGANERIISNLQAGTYTVTITDPNQCTFTLSRTLIEPQLLQITGVLKSNFNGFNTTCYDFENAWAEVTTIGGTTPYTYRWSNGSFNQRAEGLKVGNYAVEVVDANNIKAIANITITQPDKLEPNLNVTTYPNGYNISCFNCSNGVASLAIAGGVSPFNIAWSTGANANSISGLNAGNYNVIITDANGCLIGKDFNVTQPDREDWSMNGNTNSNPASQYMGTADSTDFVLKANGTESLRLKSNGQIKIKSFQSTNGGVIISNPDGILSNVTFPASCVGSVTFPWQQSPNDPADVFSCWRRFGIGTDDPQVRLEVKGGLSRFTSAYTSVDYLEIGHDGYIGGGSGNAIINNKGNGDLLINYDNNKDVIFGGGSSIGKVVTSNNTFLATNSGNVGVGTTNPQVKFEVKGGLSRFSSSYTAGDYIEIGHDGASGGGNGNAILNNKGNGDLLINYNNNKDVVFGGGTSNGKVITSGNTLLASNNGKVGIGYNDISNVNYQLSVNGEINATSYKLNGADLTTLDKWDLALNGVDLSTNLNVGIGTNDPKEKLQIGNGSQTLSLSPAYGDNSLIGYATSYLGFNLRRTINSNPQLSFWSTESDGANNGASSIVSSIGGDLYFTTVPTNNPLLGSQLVFEGDLLNYSRLKLGGTGQVGIGTNDLPFNTKVSIHGEKDVILNVSSSNINNNTCLIRSVVNNNYMKGFVVTNSGITSTNFPNGEDVFRVWGDGRVEAKKIKVSQSIWSDFVFNENYNLMPLVELNNFIQKNKHLPNVPTAENVYENGVDISTIQATLLQKIEELTLYVIQLNSQNEMLFKEINNLKNK
jgi:hypothetical protein